MKKHAALTVGGHSVGRAHGNGDRANFKDQNQRQQIVQEQGFGWNIKGGG